MSGPKFIKTPPKYSINIFDGKLNKVFKLQSLIKSLLLELSDVINDKKRNIKIDCLEFLQKYKRSIDGLLESFCLEYDGEFGQDVYDDYNKKLDNKISKLKDFIKLLKRERELFMNKKEDYRSYLSYGNFYNHSINSFFDFKSQVDKYLGSYIKRDYPAYFSEVHDSISKINPVFEKEPFSEGFRNRDSEIKEMLKRQIDENIDKINNIRNAASDKIINLEKSEYNSDFDQQVSFDLHTRFKNNKEFYAVAKELDCFIANVSDLKAKQTYKGKLENLLESEVFTDIYYYNEFLEEIRESEKVRAYKNEIKNIITSLNRVSVHQDLIDYKSKLIKSGSDLINKDKIKPYEYDDLKAIYKDIVEKNNMLSENEFVKEKEKQFLKRQLVKCLQNLNYEVMDDMKVIDFNSESDFLFKIPRQSNYLNLRFQEDGSFLYNFLIDKNKKELSIREKKQKLAEMESTCKEFKGLLKELEVMGLKLDIKSDRPVTEAVLIEIPPKYREKIRSSEGKRKTIKIGKRKYLNKG